MPGSESLKPRLGEERTPCCFPLPTCSITACAPFVSDRGTPCDALRVMRDSEEQSSRLPIQQDEKRVSWGFDGGADLADELKVPNQRVGRGTFLSPVSCCQRRILIIID